MMLVRKSYRQSEENNEVDIPCYAQLLADSLFYTRKYTCQVFSAG
jgi:hypothetical protein